jgi:diacylglycerol kinase (ATP)
MSRKILFIVNPNAGKRMSGNIMDIIRKEMPENVYYQMAVWKNRFHFDEILEILKSQDYTDAIAVGGDGTVNHIAKSILGTGIRLGIVPIGSGNGLARSLALSMQVDQVVKQIVEGRTAVIDTGTVNGFPFFCTSGVGFDAHIGNLFSASVKRGLQSYIQIITRELFMYRAKSYTIKFNDTVLRKKAFLITVANAGQYGNDFYIAPQASIQDGLFHLVILKPFNVMKVAGLLHRILGRKAFLNSSIETYTASRIEIERESEDTIHFDGEPAKSGRTIVFENKPLSLTVIVGENFRAGLYS